MLNFLKSLRKKTTALIPVPQRSSLFSTDIPADVLDPANWNEVLGKSFQRLPGDMKRVDQSGKPTERITVSTAAPNGRAFAMDAPTAGNPLSMKPLIEPNQTLPYMQVAWYASQGFIGYQTCSILEQNWFIRKICRMPCRDAMRHGYEIATDDFEEVDPKVLAFIRKRDRAFNIRKECVEFARWNRVFGIRIALPVVESQDKNYYLKPFDINSVKPNSYKGITQLDPYWITPELDAEAAANPASLHFYEPTWWRVNGQRIHRTHLVIIKNGVPSDLLKPTYFYGGMPVPQLIAERVYAAERTANEGPQLALTKRTTWMKVDIAPALAQLQTFLAKMEFFSQMRDNFGVKIGGLEDEMEQFETSLTDFDNMTMMQYKIACAAGDVPYAKFMGDSPKGGLGSEGEFDSDSYNEFKESMQEHDMQPLLERHYELLMASEVRPKFGSKISEDWEPIIHWNPVDTPNAKEQAEINEIKSRTGNNLTNGGAIDGVDERNRIAADKSSGYNGLEDREPEVQDEEAVESDKAEPGESD